ncbi:MAG: universal stress protein [Hyphomonadaceae bacterium]
MTYRNILVFVDKSGASRLRVQAAVGIARRFGASLTGVFLKAEQIPAFIAGDAFSAVTAVEVYMDERAKLVAESSAAARNLFEDIARNAGIQFDWIETQGDDTGGIIACARRHDLSILPVRMYVAGGISDIDAAGVAMAAGGPVLILPELGYPATVGGKILVAWKESREAARALHDAWPFLAKASEVTLLSVGRDAEAGFDEIQRRNLAAHGCRTAKMVVDRNDERDVGDAIRLNAGMVGADMLVLGLYGHSRLQELFLGGVSRNLLSDITLPVLVSH